MLFSEIFFKVFTIFSDEFPLSYGLVEFFKTSLNFFDNAISIALDIDF